MKYTINSTDLVNTSFQNRTEIYPEILMFHICQDCPYYHMQKIQWPGYAEHIICFQLCQNVRAAGNFAAFNRLLAAYPTLDVTRSSLVGKGAWHLLPTTPGMLPTVRKHFERAVFHFVFVIQ